MYISVMTLCKAHETLRKLNITENQLRSMTSEELRNKGLIDIMLVIVASQTD